LESLIEIINEETWFTSSSFLSYGNKLYVARVANTTVSNSQGTLTAVANVGSVTTITAQVVKNEEDYESVDGTFDTDVLYVARYPGAIGNSLRISVCDSSDAFSKSMNLAAYSANVAFTFGSNAATIQASNSMYAGNVASMMAVNDLIKVGNGDIGEQYLKITAITTNGANVELDFEDRIQTT